MYSSLIKSESGVGPGISILQSSSVQSKFGTSDWYWMCGKGSTVIGTCLPISSPALCTWKDLPDWVSVLTLPPRTVPSTPWRKPPALISDTPVSFWGVGTSIKWQSGLASIVFSIYTLQIADRPVFFIRGHCRWSEEQLYGPKGWILPWLWAAWGDQGVYRNWVSAATNRGVCELVCVCVCLCEHAQAWEVNGERMSSGAETEQAGSTVFGVWRPAIWRGLPLMDTLKRALCVSSCSTSRITL